MTRDTFRPCFAFPFRLCVAVVFLTGLPLAFLNGTVDELWCDTAAAFGAGRAL